MDASEGTVSPRRECLTSLSYVATSCSPSRDCVSHHFIYERTHTHKAVNLKQMCAPLKTDNIFPNSFSLSDFSVFAFAGLIEQFLLFGFR